MVQYLPGGNVDVVVASGLRNAIATGVMAEPTAGATGAAAVVGFCNTIIMFYYKTKVHNSMSIPDS